MKFENDDFHDIYEIKEKLGHGHFAEVKRCISRLDNTEYATKFIRHRQPLDAKHMGMSKEDIEREANILKMLNHQNIIKLHYCYDLRKNIALVLELVSGGELFDHISNSEKLSEEEASEFVEQILLGLKHIHSKQVVHLDLKPENVMIENLIERKIKLIDFGLARVINNKNTLIEMQGTAEFLAPEVINYDPISYATDMWAIGVITYIMLTGVSPFSGEDQPSTFQNIVNCRLDFDEDICGNMTDMAKSFIKALLIPAPKKRATAAKILDHSWIKPCEPSVVLRRRSSIISRDTLQSLKHYVVQPSPSSSASCSPSVSRRITEEYGNVLDESDKCELLKETDYQRQINNLNSINDNQIESSSIKDVSTPLSKCNNDQNKNCTQNNGSSKPTKLFSAPSTGNILSNSMKKWNTKLETFFDSSKNRLSNNSKASHSNTLLNTVNENSQTGNFKNFNCKRKGSLKNLLKVNPLDPPLFTDGYSMMNNASSSAGCNTKNSTFISSSAATSPTLLKKSVFFARYMEAIQGKKK